MRRFFFGLLLAASLHLEAAGPVGHAFLAHRFFAYRSYSAKDKRSFFRGTLFPDIQQLGVLDRSQTHYLEISLEEIFIESHPFYAGMKFHSFVDIEREKIVIEKEMYEWLQSYPDLQGIPLRHLTKLLKFMEDELWYERCLKQPILRALSSLDEEERGMGVEWSILLEWHVINALFFLKPANSILSLADCSQRDVLQIPVKTLEIWNRAFQSLCEDPFFQNYHKELEEHFEKLLLIHVDHF